MRPKNPRTQNGDEEGEWIMSYADTVTLLLCFFVIFFSESKIGSDGKKAEVADFASKVETVDTAKSEDVKEQEQLEKLRIELDARLKKENLKDYEIVQNKKDISIRLNERGFFKLGSYKILPKGKKMLEKISISLKSMEKDLKIQVEGHTDSKPVALSSAGVYSSNLGLSSLRASNAAEILIKNGISKNKIRAVGFGDARLVVQDRMPSSKDVAPIYDEAKTQLNRRIELKLLSQKSLED